VSNGEPPPHNGMRGVVTNCSPITSYDKHPSNVSQVSSLDPQIQMVSHFFNRHRDLKGVSIPQRLPRFPRSSWLWERVCAR